VKLRLATPGSFKNKARTGAYTGARAGEALWLDWRSVDLARAHVTFPKTKNGDARGVPLREHVQTTLGASRTANRWPGGKG
jgi:integrase